MGEAQNICPTESQAAVGHITIYNMFEHGIRYSRDLTYVWDYLGLVQQGRIHLIYLE